MQEVLGRSMPESARVPREPGLDLLRGATRRARPGVEAGHRVLAEQVDGLAADDDAHALGLARSALAHLNLPAPRALAQQVHNLLPRADVAAHAAAQRLARSRIIQRHVLSSWDSLLDYCHTAMAHRDTEQFRVLFLDSKNTLIADEEQARGTVDHVPVYPREVVKRALELNATALILVHNHPSGDPTPSQADLTMTSQVQAAADALGIVLHDHLIIGKSRELSFRSAGYL